MKLSPVILCFFVAMFQVEHVRGQFSQQSSGRWGSTLDERVAVVAMASDGAVMVQGTFSSDDIDLDPGTAQVTVSVTPTGSPVNIPSDIFAVKLNSDGSYAWGITLGQAANTEQCGGIAFTPEGDVLMAISFGGVLDIDPGPGETLTASGASHTALLKLDGANGSLLDHFVLTSPVFQFGAGSNSTRGITVAPDGGFTLHGLFTENLDMDPGAGITTVTSSGLRDGFVAKYAADMSFEWAAGLGGTGNFDDHLTNVRFGADGACYVGGFFNAGADLDPGPGTVILPPLSSSRDVCVVKYGVDGEYVWHARMVSPSSSDGVFALEVANGEVLLMGRYGTTVDVDPGAGTQVLTPVSGTEGTYVVKLLEVSGALVNAKQFDQATQPSGTSTSSGPSISSAMLGSEQFVLIGELFFGNYDVAIGPEVFNLQPNNGVFDFFLARYSWSDIDLLGAVRIGGTTGSDESTAIAGNGTGQFVIGGSFKSSTMNVNPTGPVVNLTNIGGPNTSDGFCVVYQPLTSGIEDRPSSAFRAYPNPAVDRVVISGEKPGKVLVRMLDATGRMVSETTGVMPIAIDLALLNNGIYLAQVINEQGLTTLSLVKQ